MMRVFAVVLAIVVLTVPYPSHSQSTPDGQESMCANSSVLVCESFEARAIGSGDLGRAIYKQPGWGLSNTSNLTVQSDDVFAGTKALQIAYPPIADGVNGGAGYMDFSWTGARTTYFRWYTKWSYNFVFSPVGTKQIAVWNGAANSIHLGHGLFGSREVEIIVQETDTVYRQNISPVSVDNDRWYCFEYRITMNSAPGASDGVIEGWIDDVQHWSYPNVRLQDKTPLVLNTMQVTGSGFNGPSPAQYRWHDNLVISTDRIGCNLSTTAQAPQAPPRAPTGLVVKP